MKNQLNDLRKQIDEIDTAIVNLLAKRMKIVEKIEAEHVLVEGNKKLVEIYEQKTKEVIAKIWSE